MRNLRIVSVFFFMMFNLFVGCEFDSSGKWDNLDKYCWTGEPCQTDTDNDGIMDDVDNCLQIKNAAQLDDDNDGIGNACEGNPLPTDAMDNDTESDIFVEPDTFVPDNGPEVLASEEVEEPDTFVEPDNDGPDVEDIQVIEPDVNDTNEAEVGTDTTVEEDIELPTEVEEPDTTDDTDSSVEDTFVPLCVDEDCDDSNPCTDDTCNPELGCDHADNTGPCSDENPCTLEDACLDGACVSDTNVCQCESTSQCAEHEDNNLCNGTLICVDNKCVIDASTIVVCEQSLDPCYEAECNSATGECSPNPITGESCDDNDVCTIGDACASGICVGNPRICSDENACTNDSCDPTLGCQFSNNDLPCSDNNACTLLDICSGGACQPGSSLLPCSDDKPCNGIEVCDPALGCQPGTPIACDDDDACTLDSCDLTAGCTSAPLVCDDGQECTFNSCLSKGGIGCIFYDADGQNCEDGNPCTTGDTCFSGACVKFSAPLICDDENACTIDSCDPTLGCQFAPPPPCDDGNLCTIDSCDPATGTCHNIPVVCNDQVTCTVDSCDPATGACVFTQDNQFCEDTSNCTVDFCDPVIGCAHLVWDKNPPQPGNCALSNIDGPASQDKFQDRGADLDMDCPLVFKDDPSKCDGYCDDASDYEIFINGPPFYYEGQTCLGIDNCAWVYNPDQLDSDHDGMGDAVGCDPYIGTK